MNLTNNTNDVPRIVNLVEADINQIHAHLLALSPDGQYLRFSSFVTPMRVAEFCNRIFFLRDVVRGQFERDKLVGLCHVGINDIKGQTVGDLGVSVDPFHRGKGYGKMLVEDAIQQSKELGVHSIRIDFLRKNSRMKAIAKRIGATIEVEDSDCTSSLCINAPDADAMVKRHLTPNGIEIFESGPTDSNQVAFLIHGSGGDGWQWRRRLQPELGKSGIRSIALSLGNHGKSERRHDGSIEQYVSDAMESIKFLGDPTVSVVVGHSLGGYIAQKFLEKRHASSAILLAPIPHGLSERELSETKAALKSDFGADVLDRAMRVRPIHAPVSSFDRIHIVGGQYDRVVPEELLARTAKFYGVDPVMLQCGHNMTTGVACDLVATMISAEMGQGISSRRSIHRRRN